MTPPAGTPPAGTADIPGPTSTVSPLPARARPLLLAAVAVCAACGLVYELVLLTLSASLAGGGITQTSLIVAGFVAALGAGALLVKPFLGQAAAAFVAVETLLGVLGGLSAVTLYVTFSFYATSGPVLFLGTALLGTLVGAELPLLVTLLQTGRTDMDAQGSGRLLADLNAADYAGALVGGLVWPFVLLPAAGMIRGAALTGLVNLAAAAVVAALLLRRWLTRRALVTALGALLAAAILLGTLLLRARDIETDARQRLYADPIVVATRSAYQEIVVTRRGGDLRLYLDGDLQFSSADEHRYTEALVAPALARDPARVLVLGGGDGLAARELLRHPTVRQVVQVELDPRMIELARTTFARLNRGALDDPRVRVVVADAFRWLRDPPPEPFDAVVVDMPDPDTPALGRLYSQEFYGLVRTVLAPGGLLTVQAGSPYATPRAYWRTVSTIRAAGLATTAYHVDVPSFGDWGFALATTGGAPPPLLLSGRAAPARFLDQAVLTAAGVFPPDRPARALEPSTLDRPRIVDDVRTGYQR